jgi:hypothetical protein
MYYYLCDPSLVVGATTGALFGHITGFVEYIGAFFIIGILADQLQYTAKIVYCSCSYQKYSRYAYSLC